MDNMTKTIIELVVIVVAFAIGRYILPRYKVNIQNAAAQFGVLLSYAESFCAYARQFLDCSGSEKMDNVVARLRNICDQQKINIDDEVVLIEMPQTNDNSSTVVDNVPSADDKGNVVVTNSVDSGDAMLSEIKKIVDQPSIIELIHEIY